MLIAPEKIGLNFAFEVLNSQKILKQMPNIIALLEGMRDVKQ